MKHPKKQDNQYKNEFLTIPTVKALSLLLQRTMEMEVLTQSCILFSIHETWVRPVSRALQSFQCKLVPVVPSELI